jgi:hypothetical protein
VLVNGGGCVLIEPYYGWLASKFYKKIFETECFIKTQKEWSNPEQGVMYGANQALSYIVFKRDRATFEKLYPQLEIVHTTTLKNYPRYFLSGGLNFKQLIPNFLAPVVKLFEFVFSPLASIFALHHIVVLRKK